MASDRSGGGGLGWVDRAMKLRSIFDAEMGRGEPSGDHRRGAELNQRERRQVAVHAPKYGDGLGAHVTPQMRGPADRDAVVGYHNVALEDTFDDHVLGRAQASLDRETRPHRGHVGGPKERSDGVLLSRLGAANGRIAVGRGHVLTPTQHDSAWRRGALFRRKDGAGDGDRTRDQRLGKP